MPKSIAKIREGSLTADPFTSQALSVRIFKWEQIAGIQDTLRVDGKLKLPQQREPILPAEQPARLSKRRQLLATACCVARACGGSGSAAAMPRDAAFLLVVCGAHSICELRSSWW